ncbi:MAG: hypothetical protein HY819_06650 [Acidobacteria bacterium]|nr:hypothetical protein [Acidobacteriota bacterium]
MTDKSKEVHMKEDDLELPKLDPVFYKRMEQYYQQTSTKSPPELQKKLLELARNHKKTLEREGRPNNSDLDKRLDFIINPIKDLKSLFTLDSFVISNLRVGIALLIVITIISGISYLLYQYQLIKNQNNIANQQTPTIKETPNPNLTPNKNIIPTPSLETNNKQEDNNKLDTINNPNDQKIAKEKQPKVNSDKIRNKTPDKTIHNQQIAANTNNNSIPNIAEVSKDMVRGVIVDLNLLEIKQFYVAGFGDNPENKLLKQALIEQLKNADFEVLTPTQAVSIGTYGKIVKKDDVIQVTNSSNNSILWYKRIQEQTGSPKEIAKKIVDSLLEDIKSQQNK